MTIGLFLFAIFFYIFTTFMIINIMSIFVKKQDDSKEYVNPYRLVPRKETEEYKRYERQEYLNSLRS